MKMHILSRPRGYSKLGAFALMLSAGIVLLSAASISHAVDPLKVAFVYLGPVGDGGWTYQHDLGRVALEKEFGDKIKTTYVENVPETADAERVIRQLAVDGNQIIFTTSFGYMDPTLKGSNMPPVTRRRKIWQPIKPVFTKVRICWV